MRELDYLQALRDDGIGLAEVDAESAHGDPRPVPAALAADGVTELLDVFLAPHFEGEPVGGRGESLHLHATDTEGEWRLRLRPAGVEVGRGHDQADAAAQ